jgi:hypothetical protein
VSNISGSHRKYFSLTALGFEYYLFEPLFYRCLVWSLKHSALSASPCFGAALYGRLPASSLHQTSASDVGMGLMLWKNLLGCVTLFQQMRCNDPDYLKLLSDLRLGTIIEGQYQFLFRSVSTFPNHP